MASKPVWTLDQIIANFDRSKVQWAPGQTIYYTFWNSLPSTTDARYLGFSPFNANQRAAERLSLSRISDVANVSFAEIADNGRTASLADPKIGFFNSSDLPTNVAGDSSKKISTQIVNGRNVIFGDDIRVDAADALELWGYGSINFPTLLHETSHALGLPHPGNYKATATYVPTYDVDALYYQDSIQYSVMSYFDESNTGGNWGVAHPSTLMLHDIAFYQAIYGANPSARTGNTTYGNNATAGDAYDVLKSSLVFCIWDAGGIDTIDASLSSSQEWIDLSPGAFSSTWGLVNNISIAFNVTIENATGGSGLDTIKGNTADNLLTGGAGADFIYGGTGTDTSRYLGTRSAYTITRNANLVTVSGGTDGGDILRGIEKLQFSDQTILLGQGNGAQDFADAIGSIGRNSEDIFWQNSDGRIVVWVMDYFTSVYKAQDVDWGKIGVDWKIKGSADIDGDGYSDAIFQRNDGAVGLWINNGSSNGPIDYYVADNPGPNWHIKAVSDFNGDGKGDILFQNDDGRAAIWLLNGASLVIRDVVGSNQGLTWHVVGSGDFNGDGKGDILWQRDNGNVEVWLMDGLSVIAPPTEIVQPDPTWHVKGAGDFDGNGRDDIIWQNDSGKVTIWLMNGMSHVGGSDVAINPGPSWHVVGADYFNNDLKSDILWQHDDGHAAVWLMNGSTKIGGDELTPKPDKSWSIGNYGINAIAPTHGDFNEDGKGDVIWQNVDGHVSVWLMNGGLKIADSGLPAPGAAWHVIGSGDFDGNGTSDILWQNDNSQAAVWLMNGITKIGGDNVGGAPGTAWDVKGAGDFNGDGKADILWQNDSGRAAIWFLNGSVRTGGDEIAVSPGAAWHVIGSGDFNGDGMADVLWQNTDGRAAVWLMNGISRTGGDEVGKSPGTSWHVRGAGDFDGDGKSDILWQNDDGRAAIWFLNGASRAGGDEVSRNPGPSWTVKGATDMNGDGKADILWQNAITGQGVVWLMSGTTKIDDYALSPNSGTPWHLVANAG